LFGKLRGDADDCAEHPAYPSIDCAIQSRMFHMLACSIRR